MTTRERLYIYDTTLRDGQQTQGVTFSLDDKMRISQLLEEIGIDYIEGGWPGANPVDSEFFDKRKQLKKTKLVAFGMTKRFGRSVENDETLAQVVSAGTSVVCLVGKSHDFHVKEALGISLDDNIELITSSIKHLKFLGKEVHFDAEHFFDGYAANKKYSISIVKEAIAAGADWVVLCDTNGGTMPDQVRKTIEDLSEHGVDASRLGIHAHNDTENAVANSLAKEFATAFSVSLCAWIPSLLASTPCSLKSSIVFLTWSGIVPPLVSHSTTQSAPAAIASFTIEMEYFLLAA